ncbi:MAG: ABC transporter ATP-binding protein [Eggerthella sp.]|nr:ABC transporter ATP-binding protein [Eggerthella sp.]
MLLEVDSVTKSFPTQDTVVLDQVSFGLDAGERVGIIGASGCGKTTLARIIAHLEGADAGRITFNGATVDFNNARPSREQLRAVRSAWLDMQMVFQNPAASFSDHMSIGASIWEGAAYHPKFSRTERTKREDLVACTLDVVGLDRSVAAKRAFELSGGECQRAAIARAIIGGAKLLICDEATSSLDVTVQARIMELLARLHAERGMAILFISHDLTLVQSFCDRIYSL